MSMHPLILKRVLVIVVCYLLHPRVTASLTTCGRGEFVSSDSCKPCPTGTFMSSHIHAHTSCFPCMKIKRIELEIEIVPCNGTHDTVIHCIDGYYRWKTSNEKEECLECTKCEQLDTVTARACETYRDAFCCSGKNYDVFEDEGETKCREKLWFCKRGQYFDIRKNVFQCQECEVGKFMSLEYHTRTKCWECVNTSRQYLPMNSEVVHLCNGTHDAVVECKKGFYINPSPGDSNNDMGCVPCTDCSQTSQKFEGRKCRGTHDTVCCDKPDMTVVDADEGSKCKEQSNPTTEMQRPQVWCQILLACFGVVVITVFLSGLGLKLGLVKLCKGWKLCKPRESTDSCTPDSDSDSSEKMNQEDIPDLETY